PNYDLFAQRYNSLGEAVGSRITIAATNESEAYPSRDDMLLTDGYDVKVNGNGSFSVLYTTGFSYDDPIVKTFDANRNLVSTNELKTPSNYAFGPNYVEMDNGDYVVI